MAMYFFHGADTTRAAVFNLAGHVFPDGGDEGQEMIKSFPNGEVNNGNDGGFCVQMGVAEEEG